MAYFEIVSPEHERAQKFYGELFSSKVAADPAMDGYALVDTGAGEGPQAAVSARGRGRATRA